MATLSKIYIYQLIDQILRRLSEKTSSPKLISRLDVLDAINEGRQTIGELLGPIEAEESRKALSGQLNYDMPYDFKSNLKRVEYDGQPLVRASRAVLDEYDSGWRLSTSRNPPDSSPKYYVSPENEENRFIIYPPPESDGEWWVNDGYGIPESITLYGITSIISGGAGGIVEYVDIAGERYFFTEPGFPEYIIPMKGNLRLYYDKHIMPFVSSTSNENANTGAKTALEDLLFPHWIAILDYALSALYLYDALNDTTKATMHMNKFTMATKGISDKVLLTRHGMAISALRTETRMWGRRRGNI